MKPDSHFSLLLRRYVYEMFVNEAARGKTHRERSGALSPEAEVLAFQ